MASSLTDLCNASLGLAGSGTVLENIEDRDSEAARACRAHAPSLIGSLLRLHDWNFASKIEGLVEMPNPDIFTGITSEGATAWLMPVDSLKVHEVYDSTRTRQEFRAGARTPDGRQILVVDSGGATPPLYIRHTFNAEPSLWTPDFMQGVQYLLAARLMRHLRPDEGTDASDKLRTIGEETLRAAVAVNESEGTNLFNSNDAATEVQERALSLAGARTPEGRSFGSTAGERHEVNKFWDIDRKSFLQIGELPFNRRYVDLAPLIPQPINEPSSAGYLPFYYEYPNDPKILALRMTWLRYTEYEMTEEKFTLIDKGPPIGKWILMNAGYVQGNRTDVRATGLFLIDEPDISLWTEPAKLGLSFKLAMSLASTIGKPMNFIQHLEAQMREQVSSARATGLNELGERDTQTFPSGSRYERARA